MSTVIVIGGGAAGMMAALSAAQNSHTVCLIEKNEKLGKKLFITGKGRCNFTNNCSDAVFFQNIVSNPKFLHSAYAQFDSRAVQEFFSAAGLRIKEERGGRVFPGSDHSSDVIACLRKMLERHRVQILLNTSVRALSYAGDKRGKADKDNVAAPVGGKKVTGVILSDGRALAADKVIVATGGLSYPATGSTGDGLRFAADCGHGIIEPLPALVPLIVKEKYCRSLQGLSLKNIAIVLEAQKQVIYAGFGEMLFTHFGVSGPLILSAASYYTQHIRGHREQERVYLHIDLKPALSPEQLDKRLLRDFEAAAKKQFKNILGGLFPAKLHPLMIALSGIAGDKQVAQISKNERQALATLTKDLRLSIAGTRGLNEAIVTQGGIDVRDINPATMESKIVKNLYFAGEILDVDALTGGHNLQIAWSSGHLAGK